MNSALEAAAGRVRDALAGMRREGEVVPNEREGVLAVKFAEPAPNCDEALIAALQELAHPFPIEPVVLGPGAAAEHAHARTITKKWTLRRRR